MELAQSVIGRMAKGSKPSKTACESGWIREDGMALPRASLAGISWSVLQSLRLPEPLSYVASITNDGPLPPADVTEHVRMNVQTDVGHVVDVLGGDKPDNLADLAFRIMAGHAGKSLRIHFLVFGQLRDIVQCRHVFSGLDLWPSPMRRMGKANRRFAR
jgi:hypothetical protein